MEQIKMLRKTAVFVRVDDVGRADFPQLSEIIDICKETNIPVILAVIPGLLSGKTANYLKWELENNWPGLIVAQHGVNHVRCAEANRKMEFAIWESVADVAGKLLDGKNLLQTKLGINISWYVPPWNKYGGNLILALEKSGYKAFSAKKGIPFRSNCLVNFPVNQDVVIDYETGRMVNDWHTWWAVTEKNLADDGWNGLMLHHHLLDEIHVETFREWARCASGKIKSCKYERQVGEVVG